VTGLEAVKHRGRPVLDERPEAPQKKDPHPRWEEELSIDAPVKVVPIIVRGTNGLEWEAPLQPRRSTRQANEVAR
jgi:hypothetical protein